MPTCENRRSESKRIGTEAWWAGTQQRQLGHLTSLLSFILGRLQSTQAPGKYRPIFILAPAGNISAHLSHAHGTLCSILIATGHLKQLSVCLNICSRPRKTNIWSLHNP